MQCRAVLFPRFPFQKESARARECLPSLAKATRLARLYCSHLPTRLYSLSHIRSQHKTFPHCVLQSFRTKESLFPISPTPPITVDARALTQEKSTGFPTSENKPASR